MKYVISIFLIFMAISNLMAGEEKHNFNSATWGEGESCLICHAPKNFMPKFYPPDARIIDMTKLAADEQAAYEKHPSNVLCFSCHKGEHSPLINTNGTNGAGNLPRPNTPPVYTSGSQGSTGIRVTNSGSRNSDCLGCHDVHNKESTKMLKVDYYQQQN